MKKLIPFLFIPLTSIAQEMKEPIAKKINENLTIHNHTRIDPYFWMNQRDSKDVLSYIEQENIISSEFFKSQDKTVQGLLSEFENRIDPNEKMIPFESNGNLYQSRYFEGKDYPVTYLLGKKDVVIFDENNRAKGHSYYGMGDWSPSLDNKFIAISEDFVGRRNYDITVRHFKKDVYLKDKIVETDGSLEWGNDNKTIFYVKKDPQTLRSFQVYRHTLGTDQSKDVLVLQEDDELYGVGISKSLDNQWILIGVGSSTTSEYYLIDANNPTSEPKVFLKRQKGHLYEVIPHENGFYILSNHKAPNKQLLFSKDIPLDVNQCEVMVKHDNNILLEDLIVFKNDIVLQQRKNGLTELLVLNLKCVLNKKIDLPEETYYLGFGSNDNYEARTVNYIYNSMTTPSTVYRYDMQSGKQEQIYQKELLDKSFKPENYESKRIWATANDGTKIPVSIVYKKGTDLASAPCLLYAYGSYGYTIPDVFSATRLSLLNRGFVFALAHIRGGKYMGEHWYENGKFQKKINTFTDYINAAEYLGMKGYCDKNKIYAEGGSAGGLLMGAVTNMAPYLFKGVIAHVPFVDVVTTMLDETIPLTVGEYEEWGNPNEEDFYYYMLNYSPYDNVHNMDYPNLLITTGYHDSQVQYWEPLKWIAKIRDQRTNKNLLMLDCNMDAGHGGGSGRSNERLEVAKVYAFILHLENMH